MFKAVDKGIKRVFLNWHRRSGKDLTSFCVIIREAVKRVGEYYYLLPHFTQGIKVLWTGSDNSGKRIRDYINPDIVANISETHKTIRLTNGSMIRLVGARTNSDALRGTNAIGIVFSEAAYMSKQVWVTLLPVLTANKGFILFQSTPQGTNDFYDMYLANKESDSWFVSTKTVLDTFDHEGYPLVTPQQIEDERTMGAEVENAEREWYCKFNEVEDGSYYVTCIQAARDEYRIGCFPYNENYLVELYYDLGIDDSTCIWFVQRIGEKTIFVDFLEHSGQGLEYYAKELLIKGYNYGTHYLPHDGNNRSLQSGLCTAEAYTEILKQVGISDYVQVAPRATIQFGINCVRENFRQYHFHEYNCEEGIKKLANYRKQYDSVNKQYRSSPHHDKNSHTADALRVEAIMNQGGNRGYDSSLCKPRHGSYEEYNIFDNINGR